MSHCLTGRARPALFAAALAALVSGAAFANAAPPPDVSPAPAAEPAPAAPDTAVDPAAAKAAALAIKPTDIGLGDPNAPVKWIEYASAGCPHCADLTLKVLPALKAEYVESGKVYYVLRDFPLDNVAAAATVIARCLPKDKFYPFMETLFANQAKWHGPETTDPKAALVALSAEAGLDAAGFDACLNRQELLTQITDGMEEADSALQVSSTPTSFIGDEVIVGTGSVELFKAAIDKALGVEPAGGTTPVPGTMPEPSAPAPTP